MGRLVKWHSKERVDVPDISAVSAFYQSELRRIFSLTQVGRDGTVSVLRGFKVEPEAPVTSRVKIRLDVSADGVPGKTESSAIAAEDFGGGNIDYGVVLGGKDSAQALDGEYGQLLVEFAGQPVGTYFVEMSYASVEGENANRAFWNEAGNTEFIAAVNTRTLPVWEARRVGAPTGAPWILLAEVAWDGVSISAGDITDKRTLTFEGPVDEVQFDTQSDATAVFDFSRSTNRGNLAVTRGSTHEVLDMLMRQVLDIKGQSDTGKFDRFSRPFRVPGTIGEFPVTTKTLRTIDTVSFTVGDGVTDWGDFNTVDACFAYIQGQAASLPRRVKIFFKTRQDPTGVGSFVQNTNLVLPLHHIELIGQIGAAIPAVIDPGQILRDRAQIPIIYNGPLASTGITCASLKLVNIDYSAGGDRNLISADALEAENCFLSTAGGGSSRYTISTRSDHLNLKNTEIEGICNIGGTEDILAPIGGVCENVRFRRCFIRLRRTIDTSVLTTLQVFDIRAARLLFRTCSFQGRTMGVGSPANTPSPFGMIDARGAGGISFTDCQCDHSSDEDGIRAGTLPTTTTGIPTSGLYVDDNCQFFLRGDNTHLSGAGVGGLAGTGHHIRSESTPAPTVIGEIVDNIHIGRSLFSGAAFSQSPDASAVRITSARNVWIDKNRFRAWSFNFGVNTIVHMQGGLGAGFWDRNCWVTNNSFGQWAGDPIGIICIRVEDMDGWGVIGNTMDARDNADADATVSVGIAAQVIDSSNGVFVGNKFFRWRHPTLPTTIDSALHLAGSVQGVVFDANEFHRCGGAAIFTDTTSLVRRCLFAKNIFRFAGLTFRAAIDLDATTGVSAGTDGNTFDGNRWDFVGSNHLAIHLGNDVDFVVTGNHFRDGELTHRTLAGGPTPFGIGYPAGATLLNIFDTYN